MEDKNFLKELTDFVKISERNYDKMNQKLANKRETAASERFLPPKTAVNGGEMIINDKISEIAFQNCL